jgi:hypothetical protein
LARATISAFPAPQASSHTRRAALSTG